jgi:hypothetical protein
MGAWSPWRIGKSMLQPTRVPTSWWILTQRLYLDLRRFLAVLDDDTGEQFQMLGFRAVVGRSILHELDLAAAVLDESEVNRSLAAD